MSKMVSCKTCGAEIAKSAKVCPNCGAKNKKKHIVLGIILIIFGIALISSAMGGDNSSKDAASNEPPVTMNEFNQLQAGMTYDEAVDIIGFEGEMNSQVDMGVGEEFKTEIYTWANPSGTNMNATFQGGKLVTKSQFGLE